MYAYFFADFVCDLTSVFGYLVHNYLIGINIRPVSKDTGLIFAQSAAYGFPITVSGDLSAI